MNAKAALAKAFLDGRVINIRNCFDMIGLTNAPREVSRMIEKGFGVKINRKHRTGESQYGSAVTWTDYRLLPTEENTEGIKKMKEYVNKHIGAFVPKTDKQIKNLKKIGVDKSTEPIQTTSNPLFTSNS